MDLKTAKCPKCGADRELVFSNNPLVPSICYECLTENIDVANIEHGNFFCRTYNIPFKPEVWTAMVQEHINKPNRDEIVLRTYLKQYLYEDKNNLFYQDSTADV
jgi:NMD protein affecting ribosome stability and mRNA decay